MPGDLIGVIRLTRRGPTFQVVLDARALTPCYSAFLITADVPEVYMHQFWDSVYKHDTLYRFKMAKRKIFKLNLEIFKYIFKIYPRIQGQDFDAHEEIVSFLRELGYTREINTLNDVVVDHMHQPWRTFAALINKSLYGKTTGTTPPKKARKFKKPASPKLTTVPVSTEAPTGKSKRVKRHAKKSTETPTRGVVIRETPEMLLTKKKEKVDVTRDNENESDFKHETDESKSGLESDHKENKEDEYETKITDKADDDEDEEMDYTTSQLYDDIDIRLNELVDTDKGFVQEVTTLEKEVAKLKKNDPLKTQVTALVDEHLDTRLGASRDEFINFLLITARITEQFKNQQPQILPKEMSNFAPLAAATLSQFELKMILIEKIDKSESYLPAPKHRECYKGLKKSYDLDKNFFYTYSKVYSLKRSQKHKDKDPSAGSDRGLMERKTSNDAEPTKEEPDIEVTDSDMPQDQEEYLGNDDEEPKEKVASKRDWFTKPTQPQEPTNLDCNVGKTPQQGQNQSWLITLASSTNKSSKTFDELMRTPIEFSIKTKAAQYDLPSIEDMVLKIWSPVKVAYDKHELWGISHWREQPQVEVMRKHGHGYLQVIVVRRADNDLYKFKEGNFLRLRINDIEDVLLFVRVKDLQLRVKSYQKKINVTKPETTKSEIRERDPYTPYQDPQGFIYVDDSGRNRSILMDSKVTPTKHGRMAKPYSSPRFIANCFNLRIYKDGRGDDIPLNILQGGSNSIGGVDTTVGGGKGRVGGLHLLRDGLINGNGESEADDDEYINTLRLLRGRDLDDGCDNSDDEYDKRDLLRDVLEYGDNGVDDEDPDSDGDEYSNDGGDEDPDDEPDVNGGFTVIH
nr:hypothetical protein [Tanacetum cinerariifolium]